MGSIALLFEVISFTLLTFETSQIQEELYNFKKDSLNDDNIKYSLTLFSTIIVMEYIPMITLQASLLISWISNNNHSYTGDEQLVSESRNSIGVTETLVDNNLYECTTEIGFDARTLVLKQQESCISSSISSPDDIGKKEMRNKMLRQIEGGGNIDEVLNPSKT